MKSAGPHRINAYTCERGHITVSKEIHSGVTPFAIACPACNKESQSIMYKLHPQLVNRLVPAIVWINPSKQQLKKHLEGWAQGYKEITGQDMDEGMVVPVVEHLEGGGLLEVPVEDLSPEEWQGYGLPYRRVKYYVKVVGAATQETPLMHWLVDMHRYDKCVIEASTMELRQFASLAEDRAKKYGVQGVNVFDARQEKNLYSVHINGLRVMWLERIKHTINPF